LSDHHRLERIEARLRTLTILQQRTHLQVERIVQTLAETATRMERAWKAFESRSRHG
jgi:hypothetical protein